MCFGRFSVQKATVSGEFEGAPGDIWYSRVFVVVSEVELFSQIGLVDRG